MSEPTIHVALVGNPNAGKTTLFNAMTGMRMQTGNFAGTTVSKKTAMLTLGGRRLRVVDLPGMYSLRAASPEEQIASDVLHGKNPDLPRPDLLIVVMDASNLDRNLFLLSQLLECDLPVVLALSMLDVAEDQGFQVDAAKLSQRLGCPVIPVRAREGEGVDELKQALAEILEWGAEHYPRAHRPSEDVRCGVGCQACPFHGRFTWSESIAADVVRTVHRAPSRVTEVLDAVFTHRIWGVVTFLLLMAGLFYLIFQVASVPMDLIEALFGAIGAWVAGLLPEGDVQSLLVHGVLGGVGGILVFLPQICILFFALSLLEGTGYLSRAAFVMDRLMRRVGLPGTAFVPMVSGHACAIPAIMATRVIADPRDRLLTILVVPLMSCSARLPVYTMVAALLFRDNPGYAALLFTGAYALGISAALLSAWCLRKTLLPGESKPLLLELPGYKLPRLRNAFLDMVEKAGVFVRQAGTVILLISVLLWVLCTYPKSAAPAEVAQIRAEAAAQADPGTAEALSRQADVLEKKVALEHSYAGRLGKTIEPLFRPLGYDWQISIGVLSSFAAREVIVSTLAIVYGIGEDVAEDEPALFHETLRAHRRANGQPTFTVATSVSLLVFYVLAMQCLPTQAATRQETGSWKWALFQLGYMSLLAYGAALIVFQSLRALGFA